MRNYSIIRGLNLPEYKIIKFKEVCGNLYITIRPYKKKRFICSNCGKEHKINVHSRKETTVEDLRLFDKRVFLIVKKRRVICPKDNKPHVETVEWLKRRARTTRRFAPEVSRLTAITTNQEAGWFLGPDDEAAYRIDKTMLQEQYDKKLAPPPAALNLSVDEVSYKKYHRYLTNVVDTDKKAVIWNDRGRRMEVLDRY